MIEAIFPSARHVIGGYSGSTYQFFWLLKLTKPFTKGNFTSHDYKFTVTYPNGAIANYKLSPAVASRNNFWEAIEYRLSRIR